MAEEEVQGIALGLSLDTTGWSSGIAKAKAEVGGLKAELRQLGVAGRVQIARQQAAQLAGPNAISAQFTASKGAVRDLRVAVNEHFRVMAQTGEAISVPVKLGRVPYAAIRTEIQRGIGEVPITIKLGAISGGQGALAALISQQTGVSMGRAQQTIESAAAAKGIPRRAMGGPIATRALVGERGPEILEMRGGGGYISKMVGGGQVDPLQRLMSAAGRLQPHHVAGGRDWYRQAGSYARTMAASHGMPEGMAQGLLAALSAGTSWESNKTKFERILSDFQRGKPFRYGQGLDAHRKALSILQGANPRDVFASSPKVSQFHRGIAGDLSSLTLDRWATRTSLGRDNPPTRGPARARLEAAWMQAAQSSGLAPAEFQAALWLQEKEESGQAPGQMGLGFARGGKVSPGQGEMFFHEPKAGFCTRCRVSYPAGGKSRHYLSDSHADIVSGRRQPSFAAPRSRTPWNKGMGRGGPRMSLARLLEGPSEEDSLSAKMSDNPRYAMQVMAARPYMPGDEEPDWDGNFLEHFARGGFAGGVADLRRLKGVYNKGIGLPPPAEGFYHQLNPDFSRRTAAAYEAMPMGADPKSVAAYRAFAAETEAQYRLLRKSGYTFSPSRTDPYAPVNGLTKMELAGQDVSRNKHLSAFASALDHPLLSKRENWIFRGVHDMFGHLAEGFSVGPRGEYNAAISHSQMYSPLAQLAMLAETHGQNSVVNFSPTVLPGYGGRSIAEVNKEHPGSIYADQKSRRLPQHIVDEFNHLTRRARGGFIFQQQVDHGRIDPELLQQAEAEMTRLRGKYPWVHVPGVEVAPSPFTGGATSRVGPIFLNQGNFDPRMWRDQQARQALQRGHPANAGLGHFAVPSATGVVAHEFGHKVQFAAEFGDQDFQEWLPKALRAHRRNPLSIYAESGMSATHKRQGRYGRETFAEMFAAAEHGDDRFGLLSLLDRRRAGGGPISPRSMRELMEDTLPLATRHGGARSSAARYATMNQLGYDYEVGKGYFSENRSARDPELTMPWLPGKIGKNAKGGDVPPGTYIVNEIGRELFVPKDKEAAIPPDVAAQIPGGGSLLERMQRHEATKAPAEPWKPAWQRRGLAKDLTNRRAGGGEIEEINGPGPRLWQAPSDGWIIPNRLMNKVPHAFRGIDVHYNEETGQFEPDSPEQRRYREAKAFHQTLPGGFAPPRDPSQPYTPPPPTPRRSQRPSTIDLRAQALFDRYAEDSKKVSTVATGGGSPADLARQERISNILNPELAGRTGRTGAGAYFGFAVGGGRERREARAALVDVDAELRNLTSEVGKGIDPLDHYRTRLGDVHKEQLKLTGTTGDHTDALRKLSTVESGYKQRIADIATLETHRGELLKKLETTPGGVARQIGATAAGVAAYGLIAQGISVAAEAVIKFGAPMVDAMTGWSGAALKVGTELSQQTRELGGNVPSAIAGAAAQSGVGNATLAYLQKALGPTITGQAAGSAAVSALDLRRAAYFAQTQGAAIPGLTGGPTGGIAGSGVGWQLFGGQESFSQTIARGIEDFNGKRETANTRFKLAPRPFHDPFGPAFVGPEPFTPQQAKAYGEGQAALEAFTSVIDDTNDAARRGATYLGQQDTGLKLVTKDYLQQHNALAGTNWDEVVGKFKDAANAAGDLDNASKEAAAGVVLFDTQTGKVVAGQKDYEKFYSQSAQGTLLPTSQEAAQQSARDLLAQFRIRGAQGQFERNTQIPGQFALQQLAEPFQKTSTGFSFLPGEAGAQGANGQTIQQQLDQTQGLQDQLSSQTEDGLKGLRKLISDNIDAVTPLTELPAGGALRQFNVDVEQIRTLGSAIEGFTADIADQQAILGAKQYGNNIRLLNRSLKDAQALQRPASRGQLTVGADNLGAIQRAEFDIGRQAQLLSFALTQRQINFQTAVAGFQAPGITGQERAARITEAQIEASFAQKQLNLQRQQFSLEGTAFIVQAKRAEVDVQASIDLERAAREAQNRILADQKAISGDQAALSRAQAHANSIISQASDNYGAVLSVTGKYLGLFDQSVLSAANDIRTAILGLPSLQYNQKTGTFGAVPHQAVQGMGGHTIFAAAGWQGNVNRATDIVAGEAGAGEHVVVMRNPKYGQMSAAGVSGGGAGASIALGPIYVTGNTINDDRDLEKIASRLADLVEEKLGTKAKLLGVSSF